jgi:hypothetical protein
MCSSFSRWQAYGLVGKHMQFDTILNSCSASEDNIRLWNILDAPTETWKRKGLPPFRVIPGHHGGLVSQICMHSLPVDLGDLTDLAS